MSMPAEIQVHHEEILDLKESKVHLLYEIAWAKSIGILRGGASVPSQQKSSNNLTGGNSRDGAAESVTSLLSNQGSREVEALRAAHAKQIETIQAEAQEALRAALAEQRAAHAKQIETIRAEPQEALRAAHAKQRAALAKQIETIQAEAQELALKVDCERHAAAEADKSLLSSEHSREVEALRAAHAKEVEVIRAEAQERARTTKRESGQASNDAPPHPQPPHSLASSSNAGSRGSGIPASGGTASSLSKRGYLEKAGTSTFGGSYKKRYFVLSERTGGGYMLQYFTSDGQETLKGETSLRGGSVSKGKNATDIILFVREAHTERTNRAPKPKAFPLRAASAAEANDWAKSIEEAIRRCG
jgi:hypothetical protein